MLSEKGRMTHKDKLVLTLFWAMIFAFMVVYLARIHPIVVFDADDWEYISHVRHAVPQWGSWNPAKVFPETFMTLCGDFAAFFIYPFTGNYLQSFTLVSAFAVSVFVVIYMVLYGRYLFRKLQLPLPKALLLSTLFFVLHFLIFRHSTSNSNEHMFYAQDATCYYHYTIPYLLNSSLVLYLMENDVLDDAWRKYRDGTYARHAVKSGILLLAAYLALFSNLFCSAVPAAYIGCRLVAELKQPAAGKTRWKQYVQRNFLRLLFMAGWLLTQCYELGGGRAGDLLQDASLPAQFGDTLYGVRKTPWNSAFVCLMAGVFMFFAITFFCRYAKLRRSVSAAGNEVPVGLLLSAAAGSLVFLYAIAVCTATGPWRIRRASALFGVAFYALLAFSQCSAYLLTKWKHAVIVVPLLLYLSFNEINANVRTFKDVTAVNLHYETALAIDEDMIAQILAADAAGKDEVLLFVPIFEAGNDNWPLRPSIGPRIAKALYKHGLTGRLITVTEVIPAFEKNREFHIESWAEYE